MARGIFTKIGMSSVVLLMLGGCSDMNMGMANKGEMKPPERPKALDRLESFVGNWEASYEFTEPGKPQPTKATGVHESSWACDKWVLVEHSKMDLGEFGEMSGLSLWNWDSRKGRHQTTFLDNFGSVHDGTGWYDEAGKIWHFNSSGYSAITRGLSYGEGTAKFTDDNTIVWSWKEWDNSFKWGKPVMEMTGTSHRK